jgi:RNA polymerase sigma-70 factor (ECF subfamily)
VDAGSPILALDQALAAKSGIMGQDSPADPGDIARLTRSMVRGEEAAYRDFYDRYFDRLLRYLLVITGGQEDAAREALQATLVRVVRYAKQFDSETVFWSWLTVLARSAALDEHRRKSRYRGLIERFWRGQQVSASTPAVDSDAQLLRLLEAKLELLDEADRRLIERKYFAKESVAEIARSLDATEKAVESRLVRVRHKLKQSVLRHWTNE